MITSIVIKVKRGAAFVPPATVHEQISSLVDLMLKTLNEHRTRPQPQDAAFTFVAPRSVYDDRRELEQLANLLRGMIAPEKVHIAVLAE